MNRVKFSFLLLAAGLGIVLPSQAQLNVFVSNGSSYADTNVWLTLARGQGAATTNTPANLPQVSYNVSSQFQWGWYLNTNVSTNYGTIYSDAVKLSDITTTNSSGQRYFTINNNAPGLNIYLSYGSPIVASNYSLNQISAVNPSDASYNIPYQNIEISYTPTAGDQMDISAINYFTAPVTMTSYASTDASGSALQRLGYNPGVTTAQVFNELANLTGNDPSVVLTNSSGQNTRIIGPTQALPVGNGNQYGPYPNFNAYLNSLVGQTNTGVFSNSSGYNTLVTPIPGNATYSNINVTFVLTNSVTTNEFGVGINANGTVTTVSQHYTNGVANGSPITNIYTDVNFSSTASTNQEFITSTFIYFGNAAGTTNVVLGGTGWTSLSNALAGFVDGAGTPAAGIVEAQIQGEVSSGYAFGFVGSDATNLSGYLGTPIKELPSSIWWNQTTNLVANSDVQTNSGYYNVWADKLFELTSNNVYSTVYGDRFPNFNPQIGSVVENGTNVGSVLLVFGDPVTAVPEPAAAVGVLLSLIGFAAFKAATRKKRSLKA